MDASILQKLAQKNPFLFLKIKRSITMRIKHMIMLMGSLIIFTEQLQAQDFSLADAQNIGTRLGIDWQSAPFGVRQFQQGLAVELEHGLQNPQTNVTNNNPIATGKIALAHLNERPDYYWRLAEVEQLPIPQLPFLYALPPAALRFGAAVAPGLFSNIE
jgi:hypothetical protein